MEPQEHQEAAPHGHERVYWRAKMRLEKREGDVTGEDIAAGRAPEPYEVIEVEGNQLVYGGISAIWQRLIGTGITAFDSSNAHIGVGDSSTGAAPGQQDLQAATNKLRKGMDATYPQHTDGTVLGSTSISFAATFGPSEANWTWNEWAIFNGATGNRMLNRKVEANGAKSGGSWTLILTMTLA